MAYQYPKADFQPDCYNLFAAGLQKLQRVDGGEFHKASFRIARPAAILNQIAMNLPPGGVIIPSAIR